MATIIGVKLENRVLNSLDFQKVVTEFGCQVKTRIGLHDANDTKCAPDGIVLLEVIGETSEFEKKLAQFGKVQTMKF
ncbi:MAG: hypothetical protein LKG27_03295 [Clostridiaceae bacterium]|jgi:hypothetical protein|nr:hypothetical protein [Clostridiaceae bacterium]